MSRDTAHNPEGGADYSELAKEWPELSRRLVAALRRRGISEADAEDAAQTAFERAFERKVPFANGDDLYPWLRTVAWRHVLNGIRAQCREVPGEVADRVDLRDTHDEVEARSRLRAVKTAFASLKPNEREAITSFAGGSQPEGLDRREAVRLAVRRHRARARLSTLSQRFAGAVIAVRERLRWARVDAAPFVPVLIVGAISAGVLVAEVSRSPESGAPSQTARVRSQTTKSPSTNSVNTIEGATVAAATRQRKTTSRAPELKVTIPAAGPIGGSVSTRPKEGDEPLACADTIVAEVVCFNPPVVNLRALLEHVFGRP